MSLTNFSVGRGPPIDGSWNKDPPSTTDLWRWIFSHPAGSILTILVIGKDGIGVTAEHFVILASQTQRAGIRVRLVICHDVDTQARNHGMPLSANWVYSVNNLGKYYATFWLSKLAAVMRGITNDPDYELYAAELDAKADARHQLGLTHAATAYLTDRGRNNPLRPMPLPRASYVV